MSEKLLVYVLDRLEQFPAARFWHEELVAIDARGIGRALERGYLKRMREESFEGEGFPCPTPSSGGCIRRLIQQGRGAMASCECESLELPITLNDEQLTRYEACLERILAKIADANGLQGLPEQREETLWYLGSRMDYGGRLDWHFALVREAHEAEALLRREDLLLSSDAIGAVVLTPSFQPTVALQRTLRTIGVMTVALGQTPFRAVSERHLQYGAPRKPRLSAAQVREAEVYAYLTDTRIHVTGNCAGKDGMIVLVDGRGATVHGDQLQLFMRLVVESQRRTGGWVSWEQLLAEGYLSKHEVHPQYRKRLRDEFRTVVADPDRILEHGSSSGFRIAVHPDLLTYDLANLKRSTDRRLQHLIAQLPERSETRI